jgi:predicted cupin superfamily sugar epimerase
VNGSDEIFLYHGGDPYQLRWIDSQGRFNDEPVGMDMENGEQPQRTVPSGCWQAAFPKRGGEYGWSLVACMVTPGFDFDDFELASQERIAGLYPNLIDKLSLSI